MNEPTPLETTAGPTQAHITDLETKLAVARGALLKVQTMMATSQFGGMSEEQRTTCAWAIVEQAYRETAPKLFTSVGQSKQSAADAALGDVLQDHRRREYYASLTRVRKRNFMKGD